MGLISNIIGTFSDYFRIGKVGVRLTNTTGRLDVKDSPGTSFVEVRAGLFKDGGGNLYLPLASADIAGIAAGDIFYHNGTALKRLAADTGKYLQSTGTGIQWVANLNDPNTLQTKQTVINNGASQALFTFPANAHIFAIWIQVTTPYSAGATISIQGTMVPELFAPENNDPQTAGIYIVEDDFINTYGTDGLLLIVTGTPAAGAGLATIFYVLDPSTV